MKPAWVAAYGGYSLEKPPQTLSDKVGDMVNEAMVPKKELKYKHKMPTWATMEPPDIETAYQQKAVMEDYEKTYDHLMLKEADEGTKREAKEVARDKERAKYLSTFAYAVPEPTGPEEDKKDEKDKKDEASETDE